MRTICLGLVRGIAWFFLSIGYYKYWSAIYRFFWERQFKNIPLKSISNLQAYYALLAANAKMWRADGFRELFDAVSYPAKAQEVFAGRFIPTEGFDCDDFAIHTVNLLKQSIDDGTLIREAKDPADPLFLSVCWMQGWKLNGHNVVVVKTEGQYACIDYGAPWAFADTIEGVAHIIKESHAPGSDYVIWMVSKPDLTPLEVHTH